MKSLPAAWLGSAIALLIAGLAAGCRNPSALYPKNVIAIDSDGGLRWVRPSSNAPPRLMRNPRPGPGPRQSQSVYENRSTRVSRSIFSHNPILDAQTNILIFIQGGLNDVSSGVARANHLTPDILADPNHPAYPIFVAWDASLPSAWREQYTTHRGRNAPTQTAVLLAPFTFVANLGRFVSRLPLSAVEQGYAALRTGSSPAYFSTNSADYVLTRGVLVRERYEALLKDGYQLEFLGGGSARAMHAQGLAMLAGTAPKILAEGIVDTGGKIGWDFMVRRTRTMFTTASPFNPGGMDYFGRALIAYLQEPTNAHKSVTIVGHSMGAIVANEFIRRYGRALPISNIVYLAAACGVDDFERIVIPYLAAHPRTMFYNLSLHPANDSSELAWAWTEPIAPRGSLLDWIDAYYSSTETDYGWTLGKWDNALLASQEFLRGLDPVQAKRQLHFKCFGYGPELTFGPQHHGGFDQFQFWTPEFWSVTPPNTPIPR